MTSQESWHATSDLLTRYTAGELGHVTAASVEAHLVACEPCRGEVARLAPADRLARNLDAIYTRIDDRLPVAERVLRRLGVPERTSKILVVTPSARLAWLAAIVLAIAVALLAGDVDNANDRAAFAFLVAAPLVPLAVVASTFAGRADPAREVVAAAPMPVLDLLLMRAVAVLAPATVALAITALLVPGVASGGLLWLLPSLGLAGTTLALATRMPVRAAAWLVGAIWVAAALVSVRGAPRPDSIESFVAFRPAGQLAFAAMTFVAAAVVALRRDTFEHVGQRPL